MDETLESPGEPASAASLAASQPGSSPPRAATLRRVPRSGGLARHPPACPEAATQALVRAFLGGRRPTTLRTYRAALRDFAAWAGCSSLGEAARLLLTGGPGAANRLAQDYANALVDRGLAPATVGVRLSALRSLVGLARVQGLVPWRLEVRAPRGESYRDTRGPGRRGVRALLRYVEGAETAMALRDRALVRLLVDLALRRGEAVALDVGDVDLEAGTLAVRGKGRHGKAKLTLPHPTRDAVTAWMAARATEDGPLFVGLSRGRPGTRLTGTSLARIVRRLGEAAGIEGLRPHGLRHAAITEALELTRGDIRAVQRFSRHADPRTVLLYDDAREDQAGEVARLVARWG